MSDITVEEAQAWRLLSDDDNYLRMPQPEYGFDAFGNAVVPEHGFGLVSKGSVILKGDKSFDVYAGWMESDGFHARNKHHARSAGRWTAWERKIEK